MTRIELGNQVITTEHTASAAISDGEAVHISGADQVAPASSTEIQAAVGIADAAAANGESVQVVILGKKQVTADGAVNPGEPVVPAATAGRVVSELTNPASHIHTMPTHAHTAFQTGGTDTTPGAHQAVTDGGGTGTTVQAAVDTAGQAATTVPTSTDDPGDTNSADPAPDNARALGMALTTATAAGDTITVLVGAKSG